jgi:predicted GTPase
VDVLLKGSTGKGVSELIARLLRDELPAAGLAHVT